MKKPIPVCLLLLCATNLAHAGQIYQCVDANGKTLYTDEPCTTAQPKQPPKDAPDAKRPPPKDRPLPPGKPPLDKPSQDQPPKDHPDGPPPPPPPRPANSPDA